MNDMNSTGYAPILGDKQAAIGFVERHLQARMDAVIADTAEQLAQSTTKRKIRPEYGTPVTAGMSQRDIAAALGTSTAELHRWKKLADIPEAEFHKRLAQCKGVPTTTGILTMSEPVPARGRVERVIGIIRNMTEIERAQLLELLEVAV